MISLVQFLFQYWAWRKPSLYINYYNINVLLSGECWVLSYWDVEERLYGLTRNSILSQQDEKLRGFPGGAVVENLPANAGDTGSSPGLGGSRMPRSN